MNIRGGEFSAQLYQIDPEAVFYHQWGRIYHSFDRRLEVNDLLARGKGCVILDGSPFAFKTPYLPDEKLQQVYLGKYEALYRIVTN
jgi:hypothetical protein